MKLLKPFVIVPMENVKAGEIIGLDLAGPALAIAIHIDDILDRLQCIILRSSLEAQHPCWIYLQRNEDVASFGADWCLDVGMAQEICPGNTSEMNEPGTIAISATDVTLRAGGDGSARIRPTTFSLQVLSGATRTAMTSSTVYIRKWSIWLNEAERNRPGAVPLFTHPA